MKDIKDARGWSGQVRIRFTASCRIQKFTLEYRDRLVNCIRQLEEGCEDSKGDAKGPITLIYHSICLCKLFCVCVTNRFYLV